MEGLLIQRTLWLIQKAGRFLKRWRVGILDSPEVLLFLVLVNTSPFDQASDQHLTGHVTTI